MGHPERSLLDDTDIKNGGVIASAQTFAEQKFKILKKSNLLGFLVPSILFVSSLRTLLLSLDSGDFLLFFFLKICSHNLHLSLGSILS